MPFTEKSSVWPNSGSQNPPQIRTYQRVAASFANSPSALWRGRQPTQNLVTRNDNVPIFTIQQQQQQLLQQPALGLGSLLPDKRFNYSTNNQFNPKGNHGLQQQQKISPLPLPPPLLHLTTTKKCSKKNGSQNRALGFDDDDDNDSGKHFGELDDEEDDDLLFQDTNNQKTIHYDPTLDHSLRAHRDLATDVSSIEKALIDKIYNQNININGNKFINEKHGTGGILLESKLTKGSSMLGSSPLPPTYQQPPPSNKKAFLSTMDKRDDGNGLETTWPRSLCIIVKFYRCFGFSFSGLVIPSKDSGNHTTSGELSYHHQQQQHNQTLSTSDSAKNLVDDEFQIDDYYNGSDDNIDKRHKQDNYGTGTGGGGGGGGGEGKLSQKSGSIHPERYLFLLFNVVVCIFQVCLFVYGNKDLRMQLLSAKANNMPSSSTDFPGMDQSAPVTEQSPESQQSQQQPFVIDLDELKLFANKLAHNSISEELAELKPILKSIIESLAYVFLTDDFLNLFFNLVFGGRLIYRIVAIVNVDRFDRSAHLAKRLIGGTFALIVMINIVGIGIFNRSQVWLFIQMMIGTVGSEDDASGGASVFDFEYDEGEDENTLFARKGNIVLVMKFVMHMIQFTSLALVPILFVYSMLMFRANMNRAIRSVKAVKSLNESSIMVLKDKISELNEQFKSIVRHFSIPLTISFITNTFMIIGSSCFLMINQAKNQYYMTFIFNIGMLAFVRLVVISYAGNIVASTGRELIRVVYENLHQWELNEWICFMELKQLRKDFIISIFSTYQIRQASILTMLGFALNYIVILLQTENSFGKPTNTTVIVNGTI